MNKLIYLCVIIICLGCSGSPKNEKHQYKRDNIIQVKNRLNDIRIDSLMFNAYSDLIIIDDYLLIADYKSYDYLISIFDKNTFNYITSIAYRGQGPGEIENMGTIAIDKNHRKFNVSDYGKQRIFSYQLDSVLANSSYLPEEKLKIYGDKTLDRYKYINDSVCIGVIFEPVGHSDFTQTVGVQNLNDGEFTPMPYTHPDIKKKRIFFDASIEHGLYVEAYTKQNLVSICSLEGDLKYNIYGSRNWTDNQKGRFEYYQQVAFVGNKIFVLYLNDNGYANDPAKGLVGNLATKFLVLDLNGEYVATLETNNRICHFCYDEENNRLLLSMNDEMQFGYLNLDGLVDVK